MSSTAVNVDESSPTVAPISSEVVMNAIHFFLQSAFRCSSNIEIVRISLDEVSSMLPCRGSYVGDDVGERTSNPTLVVLYTNRMGALCAAVFRSFRRRPQGVVFDLTLTSIDSFTRTQLRLIGQHYGFRCAQLHLSNLCWGSHKSTVNVAYAVSTCVLQYVDSGEESTIQLTRSLVAEHHQRVSSALHVLPQ